MLLKDLRDTIRRGTYVRIDAGRGWVSGNVEDADYNRLDNYRVKKIEVVDTALRIKVENDGQSG